MTQLSTPQTPKDFLEQQWSIDFALHHTTHVSKYRFLSLHRSFSCHVSGTIILETVQVDMRPATHSVETYTKFDLFWFRLKPSFCAALVPDFIFIQRAYLNRQPHQLHCEQDFLKYNDCAEVGPRNPDQGHSLSKVLKNYEHQWNNLGTISLQKLTTQSIGLGTIVADVF